MANLYRKGTLLIPSGPPHDLDRLQLHLHVICTDPDEGGGQMVVSIRSLVSELQDRCCVLLPHEHPFLQRPSFVDYGNARILTQELLDEGVREDWFRPKADLNSQSFLRVTRGILTSKRTSRKFKAYYEASFAGVPIAA